VATIKDVARLAGVGVGTASRAVSGKGAVSPAALEKVRRAIEELDFRPSHAARALLSGHSQTIGVYIPYLTGTFYTPILQTIYTELRAAGLNMVVSFGEGGGDARQQAIEGVDFLMARGCDGMLLLSNALLESDIAALGAGKSRLVVLNQAFACIPEQCFTFDHALGGRMAARALLDLKHREIAVIAGPSGAPDNVERIDGFLAELNEAGIDTGKLWVAESNFSPSGGWESAKELLASDYRFTALFCANDEMAVGALSYFQQAGLAVPDQVSVLGYDDTNCTKFSFPRLSSVHVPWRDLTANGLSFLLNCCYGLERPVVRQFPVSVTMRASLSKVPARGATVEESN
jgi:LacI family transcriptional regulator